MGLFNLFSKKESLPPQRDISWMSKEAKALGLVELLNEKTNVLVLAWFSETQSYFDTFLKDKGISHEILLAKSVHSSSLQGKPIVFLEHYPIDSKEVAFIKDANATEITFLNALDEPLFKQFGGTNIVALMEKMGMEKNEKIEHSLIGTSIKNIQKKIEKKLIVENSANSQEEWFRRNVLTEKNI